MKRIEIEKKSRGLTADEMFCRLANFQAYPRLCKSIESVRVELIDRNTFRSTWEARFRGGLMRWTEYDTLDPTAHRIRFEQIEGDLQEFRGSWTVVADGDELTIRFVAEFDLGIPDLAEFLEPVAEQALRENVLSILSDLTRSAYGESDGVSR